MIYISLETTPEEIAEDVKTGGCTEKELVDLAVYYEEYANRLETKYPSNYTRQHLDRSISNFKLKACLIREALEHCQPK